MQMALLLETAWGDLVIDLDVKGSPSLAKNVVKLAKARFYTNALIYSVTPNRFCQTGCPVGNGTGGSSIYGLLDAAATATAEENNISSEDYRTSARRFLKSSHGRVLTAAECQEKGRVVACLTAGIVDTIGSQFLITTAEGPDHALDGYSMEYRSAARDDDGRYETSSAFLSLGVVVEDEGGVLDKINAAYIDPEGRPYADIRIIRALVIDDPFEDPPGMSDLLEARGVERENHDGVWRVTASPSFERPDEETVPLRIPIDQVGEQDEDNDRALRSRELDSQRREDKSRAVVLEMLGDLPDADIKTPENVLFICKLNPATQDEDLELIFSRFDPAVKVEVIRDQATGTSLQYAFAEFSHKQQAVEAYFKMDNALVDDRRIKVDFSQSVASVWDRFNQRMRMPRGGAFSPEKRRTLTGRTSGENGLEPRLSSKPSHLKRAGALNFNSGEGPSRRHDSGGHDQDKLGDEGSLGHSGHRGRDSRDQPYRERNRVNGGRSHLGMTDDVRHDRHGDQRPRDRGREYDRDDGGDRRQRHVEDDRRHEGRDKDDASRHRDRSHHRRPEVRKDERGESKKSDDNCLVDYKDRLASREEGRHRKGDGERNRKRHRDDSPDSRTRDRMRYRDDSPDSRTRERSRHKRREDRSGTNSRGHRYGRHEYGRNEVKRHRKVL
jgi:peptidyl-prolyl cis-trans isomerase-like 4